MRQFIVIILNIFFFWSVSAAQIIINGGNVSGTWVKTDSLYLINGNITIPNDSTLVIEPGVTIEFQGHYALEVQGRLLAVGTESDTIRFTVNDTSGFNNADSTRGGWSGIRFSDTPVTNDSSRIAYCRLQYGKAVADYWHLNAGGALCAINFGKISVTNSLFINNLAGGSETEVPSGGAVHLAWSDVHFNETTFSYNRSQNGGAVQYHESNPVFVDCRFYYNNARNGGAVSDGGNCYTAWQNCTFMNNHGDEQGGGLRFSPGSIGSINNVILLNNTAGWGAGIGAGYCELEIANCTFTNNISSDVGGGISADNCTLFVDNSTFTMNSGKWSGGIHSWQSEIHVQNSQFEQNTADELSGGIHADYSTVDVINSVFNENIAAMSAGVHAFHSDLTIKNTSFTENKADYGGGINCDYSQVRIDSTRFMGNSASTGGGIAAHNSDLKLDSCLFEYNQAKNGNGGAIEYTADSTIFGMPYQVNLIRSRFVHNSATGVTAGVRIDQIDSEISLIDVYVNDCEFRQNHADVYCPFRISGNISEYTVANSVFANNTSLRYVAGAGFINGSSGDVYNCVFSCNYASYSDSSASSSQASLGMEAQANFFNCTFVDTSDAGGYGLSVRRGCIATVTNSIFWNCGDNPITIVTVADLGSTVYLNYCNVENGIDSIHVSDSLSVLYPGTGNIAINPEFVDFFQSDYHLSDTSPCIGSGINYFKLNDVWYYAPEFDIQGTERPLPSGSNADMGAYENALGIPSKIDEKPKIITHQFRLNQNFPNPFNPSTKISFTLSKPGQVTIKVYNTLGQKIATLLDTKMNTGSNDIMFDASVLPSGIYFYRIQAGEFSQVRKMVLLK